MMSAVSYCSLHSLVEDIVYKHGQSTAVIYDNISEKISITYNQLWEISTQIKTVLSGIVNKGEVINLCMKMDHRVPAILIGVMRAHAVFSNFNVTSFHYTYKVMKQVGSNIMIIHQDYYKELKDNLVSLDIKIITMETDYLNDYYCVKINNIENKQHKYISNVAYCITTSGTTGLPKIVMVPYDCIISNIIHLRTIFSLTSDDLVLAATALTFDPSIVEIFMTLSSGARLLILPQVVKMIPDLLLQCIYERNNVTVAQITPTLLSRFNASKLRVTILGDNSSLRVIALGGEAFPTCSYISSIKSCSNETIFYNLYGITEVSCWSTCYKVTQENIKCGRVIPLGDVLSDTNVEIRDSTGQLSENGFLYVGGCKRKCYIDDEIFDGCKDDIVMRNTGDLVWRDDQGHIYYLGRNDSQIKRNGQRINLEEIKMVCLQHTSVHVCHVELIDDNIIIFIYNKEDVTMVTKDDILQYVKHNLPSYYIADDVIILQQLPITYHGKIDRDILQQIYRGRHTSNNKQIDILHYFKTKWMVMLGLHSLSSSSMFISDGGTSIQAVYLVNDIQHKYNVTLPGLVDLVLHGTLSNIETYITNTMNDIKICDNNTIQHDDDGDDNSGDNGDVGDCVYTCSFIDTENVKESSVRLDETKLFKGGGVTDDSGDKDNVVNVVTAVHDTGDDIDDIKQQENQDEMFDVSKSGKRKRSINDTDIDRDCQLECMEQFVSDYSLSRCNRHNVDIHDIHIYNKSIQHDDIIQYKYDNSSIQIYIEEVWRYNTCKCVDASPVVACNRQSECYIFIGSHSHKFSAINYYNGQCLWETMLPDRIESSACISYCGKYVIVGCYDGYLYTININYGTIYWRYNTSGTIKCSPVVNTQTGHVFIGSHSHMVYCVNIYEQKCIWHRNLECGSIFSSPVICQQSKQLYVATLGGKLFALNMETGDTIWIYKFNKPIFSTPNITDTHVYIGSTDGCLYSFNKSGHMVWKVSTDNSIFSSPSVFVYKLSNSDIKIPSSTRLECSYVHNESIVIGSHDECIYCISNTGEIRWKIKTDSPVYSSPFQSIVDLHCKNCTVSMETKMKYDRHCHVNISRCKTIKNSPTDLTECTVASRHRSGCHDNTCSLPTSIVIVCSSKGTIYIIDITDGTLLYNYIIDGEIFSSPIIYDNCIIIGSRDDYLYCFHLYLQSCMKQL
ncbi:hypothetical protein ACF0H5_022663 [Mactra antiquata]